MCVSNIPTGRIEEYTDLDAKLDPAAIDQSKLKEMDCITCHNRVSHLVPTPEETVDQLIARGADLHQDSGNSSQSDRSVQQSVHHHRGRCGRHHRAGGLLSNLLPGFLRHEQPDHQGCHHWPCRPPTRPASIRNKARTGLRIPIISVIKTRPAASAVTMASIWTPTRRPSAWNATCATPSRW